MFSENAAGLKVARGSPIAHTSGTRRWRWTGTERLEGFHGRRTGCADDARYLKHYGQYYRLDLYIQNNTDRPVKYDFKNTSVASRMGPVKVFRQRGYLNRIGAQKTAKTIGIGIGTLFVTFVMAAIVRGDPDDRDSLAEDLLRDLGGTAIEEVGS